MKYTSSVMLRKFKNWFLRTFCGYVRMSDYVIVTVELTPVTFDSAKLNPELIVGKEHYDD